MQTSAPPILWVKEGDNVLAGIKACLRVIQTLERSPTQLTPPTPPSDEEQGKRRKKSNAPKQMISAADVTYILRSQAHQHVTDCFLASVLPYLIKVGERPDPAEGRPLDILVEAAFRDIGLASLTAFEMLQKFAAVLITTGRVSEYACASNAQADPGSRTNSSNLRAITSKASRRSRSGQLPSIPSHQSRETFDFSPDAQSVGVRPSSIESPLSMRESVQVGAVVLPSFYPPDDYGANWYNVGEDYWPHGGLPPPGISYGWQAPRQALTGFYRINQGPSLVVPSIVVHPAPTEPSDALTDMHRVSLDPTRLSC